MKSVMKRLKLLFLAVISGLIVLVMGGAIGSLPALSQTPVNQAAEAAEVETAEVETAEAEATEADPIAVDPIADEPAEAEPASAEPTGSDSAAAKPEAAPQVSEAERIRRKLLIQGDRAYLAGDVAAAEALYRQAKDQTWLLPAQFARLPPAPFSDEALLSPGAAVYWREANQGIAAGRSPQSLVALALLTAEYPAFTQGHILYANTMRSADRLEEANAVLDQALTLYPAQPDLLIAQVDMRMAQSQWLEAAIASRQFVALNPDHPAVAAQAELAKENLDRFQGQTRAAINNSAIANIFTGVLGYAFTGSIFGPITAAQSGLMLLQGENAIGAQYASLVTRQLPMLQNPEVLGYVRGIGSRLAAVTGRRDLDYESFVILDPGLNAFALPGGKVFVNAGAILDTHSEAELAGLIAHELSHSVLSHGFQIATQGNLSSSLAQYLPYGGLINNVFLSGYSRQMERQADIVGTQILAAGKYAADGLHNVMITLNQQSIEDDSPRAPSWIATHPNPEDRVTYLKTLVERGGYNRYAYEGVASHEEIQVAVAGELAAYEAKQKPDAASEAEAEGSEPAAGSEESRTDLFDAVERFNW